MKSCFENVKCVIKFKEAHVTLGIGCSCWSFFIIVHVGLIIVHVGLVGLSLSLFINRGHFEK